MISVWKSSLKTGKRPELDRTRTDRTGNSQDRKRPQLQSGPRSIAISKISGPQKTGDDRLACGTSHSKILSMSLTSAIMWWNERKFLYPRHHEMVLKFLTLPGEHTFSLSVYWLTSVLAASTHALNQNHLLLSEPTSALIKGGLSSEEGGVVAGK